ncbi:MAG: ATP-binding protein [Bryobacteraceae bacterium]
MTTLHAGINLMGEEQSSATKTLDILLDSTLDSVDEAEKLVLGLARELGFPEDDLHDLGMAVREAMVNAVVHGNRYNLNKKVHLSVTKETDRLSVKITDEGEGFERTGLPDPLAEENLLRQSGRGLLLIQAFVDEFHMVRVPPLGTEVKMVKCRKTD